MQGRSDVVQVWIDVVKGSATRRRRDRRDRRDRRRNRRSPTKTDTIYDETDDETDGEARSTSPPFSVNPLLGMWPSAGQND